MNGPYRRLGRNIYEVSAHRMEYINLRAMRVISNTVLPEVELRNLYLAHTCVTCPNLPRHWPVCSCTALSSLSIMRMRRKCAVDHSTRKVSFRLRLGQIAASLTIHLRVRSTNMKEERKASSKTISPCKDTRNSLIWQGKEISGQSEMKETLNAWKYLRQGGPSFAKLSRHAHNDE